MHDKTEYDTTIKEDIKLLDCVKHHAGNMDGATYS